MADNRSVRGALRAISRPDSPCLTGSSVAAAIGGEHAEAPDRCRPRAGIARYIGFVASAAAAAVCATVLALAVTPAQAQTVTIEKISGKGSFNAGATTRTVGTLTDIGSTAHFRIRYRGSDAPFQQFTGDRGTYAGITIGVEFDYEGRDLESWANSNYTTHPGNKISRFEVVLARAWEASGSIAGNRIWDVAEVDMGFTNLHLIGPVIVRLYDPPGGRPYSLGSEREICLVINQRDGTAGEPCSSSQRRSVELPRLTGSFDSLPDSHDGQTAFTFRIQFSEDIDTTVEDMRDHALNVSGGTVTGAARVKMRDDLWSFTITPSGDAKVEIILAGGASCTADGAICTSDGRQLSTGLLTSVSGPLPTLSIGDAVAYEGVDDHMTFYVSMDRAATERAWFNYATADGTAEAGSDYTAKGRELYFFPGELVRWMIEVPIIDDTVDDDGETFTVTLSDPRGVTIGRGVATGTIRNSEEPVEVSVADAEATEGEDRLMRFRLSLNRIAKDVTVHYATADGTATAGVDYVATSGSMVIRKGTINTEITVPILSDSVEDDGENFTLTLSNASGAEIADGEAVGTIRDGDSVSTIQDGESEPTSTGALWSADMSAVDFGNGSIGAWGTDKFSNVGGSGELTAKWLWYHTGDRKLHLAFTTAIADTTGLSLYIGDASVAFPDGGNESSFSWTDVDIAWADGETVPVRIAKGGPVAVTPVNTSPTGAPAITGTPQVGEVLTASISDIEDDDGLDSATFAYQWLAHDGTDDREIADATGSTHEVAPAEVGKTLKVRVTFTDDAGTEETLTSVATETVAARAPDAPGGLTVAAAAGRAGELEVSWTAPASDGGSEVTGYKVQWKSGSEAYDGSDTSTRQALVSDPAVLTHTITGLTVGTAYTVRVLAVNAAGDGAAAEAAATAENRAGPTISSVAVSSDTGGADSVGDDDGVYAIDDAIEITVTFDRAVTVTGAPVLELDIGGEAKPATYANSTGNEVVFSYTVDEGDEDTDGIAIGANKLTLDGGTIQDASGNDANLAHESLAAQSGHLVDGVRPTIVRAGLVGTNGGSDNVYIIGESVGGHVEFTEAVTVNGSPKLTLELESGPRPTPLSHIASCGSPPSGLSLMATLSPCDYQDEGPRLLFLHTVARGDEDPDGLGIGANALTLNGATIADLAGNEAAILTHAAVTENTDFIVDGVPPAISSVEIVSDPGDDDTYGVGDVIWILIKFDDHVYVYWHPPRLRLDVGGKTRMALLTRPRSEDISEDENGKVLAFTYTVADGDNDDNGISIGANALQLGFGELKETDNLSRNDADITHAAVSDDAGHKVSTPASDTANDDETRPKSGLLTITGTVKVGNTVSADTSNLTDEDGLAYATYRYVWTVEGVGNVASSTSVTYTIEAAHEGKRLRASVNFVDDNGNREERSSTYTQPVKPIGWSNSAPTGAPAITGTAQVGEVLTASISDIEDADGLDNATFAYQWLAHDGTDDTEIAGATGSTHEVARAEVGKTLKMRVTFTDDVGTQETLTSVATETVAARLPDAPGGLTVAAAARAGELDVSWTAPASDGGSEVTGYKVQWKSGTESYDGSETSTRQALVSDPAVLTHTITGLTVGTAYTVRVLAANAAGDGAAAEAAATAEDRVVPTLTAASVNGTALTLTLSEALAEDSKPSADAFSVTVAGDARTADAVSLSGSAVTLTLASAVASGETVTVGYTAPTGSNASPLKDTAGNAVASFTGEAVTNDTPAAGNTAPTGLPEISGTAEVGEVLTVSVTGITDADDIDAETFAYQWLANNGTNDTEIAGATSKTYTVAPDDAGKTLKVRVTFTDEGGTEEVLESAATEEVLESAATETVPVPLTAQFRGVPESHDGTSEFSFEVLFSEPVRVSYLVLKNHSFAVTGGTVEKARRTRDENGVVRHDLRKIHIEPNTQGDVTVVLAGGRACGTQGAICTADEKVLSGTLRLTVPGPASTAQPAVSVAGGSSPVTEGAAAAFTLTRTGDVSAALTVAVEVTESGAMLAGDAPTEVTFVAASATAALTLATVDDEAAEAASVLAVTVASGDGYTVASEGASAEVTVADDDAAPVVTTALALAVAENAMAVATLEATDTDTEDLAWSIAGGADAGAFTLTEAGALSFKASKDFEAADDADGDGTYEVTVRVTDGANPVDAALTVGLTDVDEIAPALTAASVNATALTLTFSEALDAASKPAADAFAVTVAGDARTVDAVALSVSTVELTLASAVASGETVMVGYTAPTGANATPLKDASGNPVAGFSGEAVTNETPEPENSAPTGLPEISGTPKVGEVLTASTDAIEDGDGLDGVTFAYQWLANDGQSDTEIEDATGVTHEVAPAEVGKTLKVRVTFTDDKGTEEVLTSAATETVEALPVAVSIAAAATPVTEGTDAVFTLTRTGDASAALTVGVSVSVSGAFLDGTAPTETGFAAGASTATLRVATANDGTAEADGRISASIASGTGYVVTSGDGSAGVDVFDNDEAAPAVTVLWSADMTVVDYENGAIGAGSADLLTNIGGSEDLGARSLWYWAPGRKLHLKFSKAIPAGDGLTLHIGSRALALPAGSAGNPGTAWEGIDIAWSDGETIEARLTKPAAEDTSAAPGLSVADARVREAAGAELAFRVTLDAAAQEAVSVRYATADGTAVAGADYVAARGSVRFAPGQTSKTVKVLVLEDAHDDNGETLTLTLSSPFGATLADATATGTIENTDPVPQAWLARFGRTVAGHVVDAISGRFEGPADGGSHMTLGGQRLSLDGAGGAGSAGAAPRETSDDDMAARDGLAALAERIGSGADGGVWTSWDESGSGDGWMRDHGDGGTRDMTGRELLLGSSFHLALGNDKEGAGATDTRWTAWGQAATSRFDGDAEGLSVDGEVTTFTLGADAAWARWLAGVAVSLSEGEGGFRDHPGTGQESRGTGELESTLTSVHPYLRYEVSERLSVWGILGYGTGELTLEVEDKESWTTDTTMEMAAAGARGVLVPAPESGGVEVALRTDAQLVRMTSEAARGSDGGNLAATEGDTSRLRVMLAGSRAFALEGGGALTPSLEVGLRHDGGDAETGTGIEVGGGVSYTDPGTGITVDAKARGLVAHEDTDYAEWGASGSVRVEPDASGRGLSLTLAPAWGADSGGAERLWSAGDARGLAPDVAADPVSRLEAEVGYGFSVFGGRGVATPQAAWSRAERGEALRLGQRLNLGASEWRLETEFGEQSHTLRASYGYRPGNALELGLEAIRREAANDDAPGHAFMLHARIQW